MPDQRSSQQPLEPPKHAVPDDLIAICDYERPEDAASGTGVSGTGAGATEIGLEGAPDERERGSAGALTVPLEPLLREVLEQTRGRTDRPSLCARAYAAGFTLDRIAAAYGVSRERIRQIINGQSGWRVSDLRAARTQQTERERAALEAAVHDWSMGNQGAPIDEAAEALGVDANVVRTVLGRSARRHDAPAPRRSGGPSRRSDGAVLEDLRRFHAETGKTSSSAFDDWSRAAGVPGRQTAMARSGSWNKALAAAGIRSAPPVRRRRLHETNDLWAALVEAVGSGAATAREYDDWARASDGAPSLALLRQRLDSSWSTMYARALEVASGRSNEDQEWLADVLTPRDWNSLGDDREPADHLRDAHRALGAHLTAATYGVWAAENERPAAATLQRRTGMTWNQLVGAVGAPAKRIRVSKADKLAALRAYLATGGRPTQPQYEVWRKRNGQPSGNAVAAGFGGWTAALEKAQEKAP